MSDNNELISGSEEHNRDNIVSRESENNSPLDRLPGSYKSLLIWLIVVLCTLPFGPVPLITGTVFLVVSVRTFILGIKALRQIKRSNGTLSDNGCVLASIITPLVVLLSVVFVISTIVTVANRSMSIYRWRLRGLGEALTGYAESHGGHFPEPAKWCDTLKDSNAIDEWAFGYREGEKKSCDYALNRNAAIPGKDAPADMVLLFESRPGWNQVGGLELLREGRPRRVNILFVDNRIGTFRKGDVQYLRWKPEDSGVIPGVGIMPFTIGGIILAFVIVWIFIRFRNYTKRYLLFILLLGILSMGVGMLLGTAAEDALYAIGRGKGIGWIIGGITGFLVGISYVPVLARYIENKKTEISAVGYAALSGMLAGAICSTIVHAFLMIGYRETSFFGMLAGLGFGIPAGAVLGWISSGIIMKFYIHKQVVKVTQEGESISNGH